MKEVVDGIWNMPKEDLIHQLAMGFAVGCIVALVIGVIGYLIIRKAERKMDKKWERIEGSSVNNPTGFKIGKRTLW